MIRLCWRLIYCLISSTIFEKHMEFSVRKFILTGAPGAGKTTLINELSSYGFQTVPEAATLHILEQQKLGVPRPWEDGKFIGDILQLQQSQIDATISHEVPVAFFDRSPFCTLALCRFLKQSPAPNFMALLSKIVANSYFERRVFYFESLGFIENNTVRTISFEDAKIFGDIHRHVYSEYGFELVSIENETIEKRLQKILDAIDM
jgi:predicted ATPase